MAINGICEKELESLHATIIKSIEKFDLALTGKVVLTEAATGNYVTTPIIAAAAGAEKVYAVTRDSKYGSVEDVKQQTFILAEKLGVDDKIEVITDLDGIDLGKIDILTNTGFLRPIDKKTIDRLSPKCVIPLMWETWEYRAADLDIEATAEKGIKVYGTNEDDSRLKTKEYIGYMVLLFLLQTKHTPIESKVLILGCKAFTACTEKILRQNGYDINVINDYSTREEIGQYDAIVLLEHENDILLIGKEGYIKSNEISYLTDVIHICGNVDFFEAPFRFSPQKPAPFGYMSFTADYMGSHVVIDLHTAGFKVAEGMIEANKRGLAPKEYREFMEEKYPALSFNATKYW